MEDQFTHWVRLPADTSFVQFGELPHLIADALWPPAPDDGDTEEFRREVARQSIDDELRKAVDAGRLKVRDPLTRAEHSFPMGNALKRAHVLLPDLRDILSERLIGMRVGKPHLVFSLKAAPTAIPDELAILSDDAWVDYIEQHAGSEGAGRITASCLRSMICEVMERQSRGFYTLREAAQVIADTNDGICAKALLYRFNDALRDGKLLVRDPATQAPRLSGARVRDYFDWVTPNDIDAVLFAWGVPYRFPQTGASMSSDFGRLPDGRCFLQHAADELARQLGMTFVARERLMQQMSECARLPDGNARKLTVRDASTALPLSHGVGVGLSATVFREDVNAWLSAIGARYSWQSPLSSAPVPQPLQRQLAQDAAILAKLGDLGFNPKALPAAEPGKPSWPKQQVRTALGYTKDVMNKAWQRLRDAGEIKDARP